jgi:riboflavin-specific deaminase-like protein
MIPIERLTVEAESHRKRTGAPLVTLSYAQSLDGSIAAARGKPLALSGLASQQMTHRLRAVHDAILVGIGTILADDPQLTVRLAKGDNPQPVVVDSTLSCPLEAKLLKRKDKFPWIAATDKAEAKRQTELEKAGAYVIRFPEDENGLVPLLPLVQYLAEKGINSLMVEGGARIIGAFLSAGLVDQAVITIAPCFEGGLPAVDFGEQLTVTDFPPLRLGEMNSVMVGDDLVIWGKVSPWGK